MLSTRVYEKKLAKLKATYESECLKLKRKLGVGVQKDSTHVQPWRLKDLFKDIDVKKDRILCKGEDGAPKCAPKAFKPYVEGATCCKKKQCCLYFRQNDIEAIRIRLKELEANCSTVEQSQEAITIQMKYLIVNDQRCCEFFEECHWEIKS